VQAANVEHTEQSFPLLFLYRKEVIDSGGAGRHRGGLSAESCFIPHHTDAITQDTLSSGNAMPTSPGMMAGYPGSVNVYKFKRATDVFDRFRKREIPTDIAQVKGEEVTLQLRQENFVQNPSDVYAVIWSAAGGFGDPLERDPLKVREDVLDQRSVSVAAARAIYGVVIDRDHLDPVATKKLRAERRAANRKEGTAKLSARSSPASPTTSKCAARPGPCAAPAQSAPPTWDRCATTTRTTACAASPTSAPPTPTSATTSATSTTGRCSASSSARAAARWSRTRSRAPRTRCCAT